MGLLVVACAAMLSAASPSGAQSSLPTRVKVEIYQVRLDMISEFVSIQKEWAALEKKAGTPFYNVAQTSGLGETGKFVIVSPVASVVDFGESNFTGPERDTLIARATNCVVSRRVMSVTPLTELSKPTPPGQPTAMSVFQIIDVASGREQEYIDWMRTEYMPNLGDDVRHVTGRIGLGGGGASFIRAVFFDDYEDIAKGPVLARAVGPERAATITAKRAGIVMRQDGMVLRRIADASYDTRSP